MFSNKKDQEILELKDKIEILESKFKQEEKLRLETGKKADREYTDFLIYKKESQQREVEFNIEIARLRKIIAAEKKKRVNSASANRRRLNGR